MTKRVQLTVINEAKAVKLLSQGTATEWGHSRWAALERCPREYALRYVHNIYPAESNRPASLGTAVHRGLAATYWAEIQTRKGAEVSSDLYKTVIMAGREDEMVKAEAIRLVKMHNAFWATGWTDPFWVEPIAVEKPISFSIGKVKFTTRVDLVVRRRRNGSFWPVDHKTASRDGDSSSEYGLSPQFMGTLRAWPYKDKPNAVIVNKLIKTKVPGFHRVVIPFTKMMVQRWERDLIALANDLERYLSSGYFPRRYESCMGRYGPCNYQRLCMGGPSMQDGYVVPERVNLSEALR